MLSSETIRSIAGIVGPDNVLSDPYDLDRYSADALNPFRAFGAEDAFDRLADLVVRPSCTQDVADIVVLAAKNGIPIIPYGGGTGVMGGATTITPGIVLDMGSLNNILGVSLEDATATVQPGVILGDLDEVLQNANHFVGHDPWSQPIATVGGTVSVFCPTATDLVANTS